MEIKRIGVIFGGKSDEHEVSLMSASSILRALNPEKFEAVKIGITRDGRWLLYEGGIDDIVSGKWQETAERDLYKNPEKFGFCVFGSENGVTSGLKTLRDMIDFALPILHGPNGEDGTVQGMLEVADIPYGGCGVLGCACTMDKIVAKKIFECEGLAQAKHISFSKKEIMERGEELILRIEEELPYPVFIKPANMGSSVGITKVHRREEMDEALKLAASYDARILAEEGIDARELEIPVMGNDELAFGAIGEILPAAEFYDYKSKYFDAASRLCIPADITGEEAEEIRQMAGKAYKSSGCQGYARVDFFMDKKDGRIYINEINAIPGFTHISMFPLLFMEAGMTYPEIIERIVELGYERYYSENNG